MLPLSLLFHPNAAAAGQAVPSPWELESLVGSSMRVTKGHVLLFKSEALSLDTGELCPP